MAGITANIEQVIATARSQIGYSESPRGSNRTKYGIWYSMNGVPWCAIFQSWCFALAGSPLPRISSTKGFSYVPDVQAYAKRTGTWKTRNPKRGDLVLFSFGGRRADHVGLVQGVLPDGRIHTVEGNTNAGGSRTGGSVAEAYRRSGIIGYVSVNSGPSASAPTNPSNIDWAALRRLAAAQLRTSVGNMPNMDGNTGKSLHVVVLQQALNMVSGAKLREDGSYGPATIQAVVNFQKWMNALGAGIKDFPGACHEFTRWWLCVALENIRDGKA